MSRTSFGDTPTSSYNRRNTSAEQIGAKVTDLGYDWIKSDWHIERIMARAKDLAADHTSSAIERGWILLWLRARWGLFRVEADYEKYDFGMNSRTGQRLTKLVLHERMGRDDWERPRSWYACYLLLEVSDKLFEIMIGQNTWKGRNVGFIDRHTTQRQILDFKRMYQTINSRIRHLLASLKTSKSILALHFSIRSFMEIVLN